MLSQHTNAFKSALEVLVVDNHHSEILPPPLPALTIVGLKSVGLEVLHRFSVAALLDLFIGTSFTQTTTGV
jgi:hypothetical protein